MKMTKRFAGILLVALVAAWVGILLTAGDSTAQLYRYTDKNGKVVFTDNPPPGVIVVPLDDEKKVAPGEVKTQVQGGKPSPQPQAGREPAAPLNKEQEAETKKIADEEIQKKQEELQRRLQERQQEKRQDKQRRLEEADRLEREAKQPVQPTQENIDRQRKLMEDAQRLRDMP
jgi:type IV secretory pathway VirB10-like protein